MNEKWFSLSIEEIEKKLKTNAAQGLTRRAARSRYSKRGAGLFAFEKRSYLSLIGEMLLDFSLIVFLILSLSAIFFEEYVTGIVTSILTLMSLAVAIVIWHKSESFCDRADISFLPRCKVIRQGKLYEIRGDHLVVGDVILVDEGDVLCCDARLMSSEKLLVRMRTDKDSYKVLEKLAEGHVQKGEYDAQKHVNMIHAGSVVLRGAARAIVTATGGFTYIGAKVGTIFSASEGRKRLPHVLSVVKRHTSGASLAMLLASLPVSFIAILLGGENLSLFSAFMTTLAVSVCCMAHFSDSLFKLFLTLPLRRCIASEESASIRHLDAFDRLGRSKYLLLLDGGAFTDGIAHFESAYCADCDFEGTAENVGASVRTLAELASLYESAQNAGLSAGRSSQIRYGEGIDDLVKLTGCDRGALKIRCSVKGFAAGNGDELYDKAFFTDLGEEYMICVSEKERLIHECSYMICDGRKSVLTPEKKTEFLKKHKSCLLEGKTPIIFAISTHKGYGREEELCLSGMIVLSERLDCNAPQALSELQSRGVKLLFFKDIKVNGSDVKVSPIPNELFGKAKSYSTLSDIQVCELITLLKKSGESVAVVGSSERFERIYRMADVVISALPDALLAQSTLDESEGMQENEPSSLSISQTLKYRSDAAIQRPTKNRGGLSTLSNLCLGAATAYANIALFFKYLVCIQAVRMAFVLFPMMLGNAALDARHVIFGGAIFDMIALLSFAFDKNEGESLKKSCDTLARPLSNSFGLLCSFVICSALALLIPELISLLPSAPAYLDKREYSFICLTLLNISLFLSMRARTSVGLYPGRSNRPMLSALLGAVVLLILIYTVPYFSMLFGIEGFSAPVYLFAAFISPVVAFVAGLLFGNKKLNNK